MKVPQHSRLLELLLLSRGRVTLERAAIGSTLPETAIPGRVVAEVHNGERGGEGRVYMIRGGRTDRQTGRLTG